MVLFQGKKQTRIAPVQLKPGKAQDTEGPPESFIPELEDGEFVSSHNPTETHLEVVQFRVPS